MAPVLLFAGLGNMGRGMCKNLVEKGNLETPLLLWNRSIQRAKDLSAALSPGKTQVVEDLSTGIASADTIFLCLSNDEAVRSFIEQATKENVTGKLFVDCSTIHPETTEEVAKTVQAKGADFVAAPVFGAPAAADAGQLVIVLAGPAASVARAQPWCKGVMGKAEIDMTGKPYGKATSLKVLGNAVVFGMVEQIAEAHVAAEKCGLGTDVMHQFIDGLFGGPYSAYSNRMLSGDYWKREEPLFAADLARKDARHAKSLADSVGTKLSVCEIADAHVAKVQERSGSKGDIAGIYGAVREEAGLKFENE